MDEIMYNEEAQQRLEGLLKFLGKNILEINEMKNDILKENKKPKYLRIPGCYLLGLELIFDMDIKELMVSE